MMCLSLSSSHHIIFEQVGEMASSVTYIHVKFEVSFDDFQQYYDHYIRKLDHIADSFKYDEKFFSSIKYNDPILKDFYKHIIVSHLNSIRNLCERRKKFAVSILHSFEGLRNAMPGVESDDGRIHHIDKRQTKNKTESPARQLADKMMSLSSVNLIAKSFAKTTTIVRQPRGFISLGLGTLGTFMGLYNTFQIRNLQRDLEKTQDAHNRLVEVVQNNYMQMLQLNLTVQTLIQTINFTQAFDISTMAAELLDIENTLRNRLNQMVHAVQKAQDHRLAMDFLPADQLKILYDKIQGQANNLNHKLLTTQPSDLFQLELSYFYDGQNMQMLLHVPAIPKDSLLRLFKLHPFPLPIDKNYSVIPMVQNELLAISSGFNRLSAHLSSVDLLGCHAVNNVYLCERHGVLHKQLNNSCLGALYLQHFHIVQEICPLFIQPATEMVRQLLNNWFLIFSPHPQTAYISCRNGTQGETYIKAGITNQHLSPGCQLNLNAHLLTADYSINLPTDIIHFQWDWDTQDLFYDATNSIEDLILSGIENPTVQDLSEYKLSKPNKKWMALQIFISFICSILALSLITLLIGTFLIHPKLFNTQFVKFLKPVKRTNINNPPEEIQMNILYPNCPLPSPEAFDEQHHRFD